MKRFSVKFLSFVIAIAIFSKLTFLNYLPEAKAASLKEETAFVRESEQIIPRFRTVLLSTQNTALVLTASFVEGVKDFLSSLFGSSTPETIPPSTESNPPKDTPVAREEDVIYTSGPVPTPPPVPERVINRILSGVSTEYLEQRLASIQVEIDSIKTSSPRSSFGGSSESISSRQIDNIYNNLSDRLTEGKTDFNGASLTVSGDGTFGGTVTAGAFVGDGSQLTGISSFSTSTLNTLDPIQVGFGNVAGVGDRSSAIGYCNTASGNSSSAFGACNSASAYKSTAFGSGITNNTDNSVEIGANNTNKLQLTDNGVNWTGGGTFCVNGTPIGGGAVSTSTVRGMFSSSASGLTYTSGTGAFSLTSGYSIPKTASTTEWSNKQNVITTGTTVQYFRGDLSLATFPTAISSFSNDCSYINTASARTAISSSASGLTYTSGTGAFSLTSGYNIPLSASSTNWNNFYNTPSSRITAGTGLTWSGNTLSSTLTGYSVACVNALSTIAVGNGNTASGYHSSAFGYNNTVLGNCSSVFGSNIYSNVDDSVEIGPSNSVKLHIDGYGLNFCSLSGCGLFINGSEFIPQNACCSSCSSCASCSCSSCCSCSASTVGYNNCIGSCSASAFGYQNSASTDYAVAIGALNCVQGYFSSALGYNNYACSCFASSVGTCNSVTATCASAFGMFLSNSVDCSVMIGTGSAYMRVNGNGSINFSNGGSIDSSGVGSFASDRNLKENFTELDSSQILASINNLPITKWNYIAQDPSTKYIGPTAQDFYNAFGLGNSSTKIPTFEPGVIALVGIQELSKQQSSTALEIADLKFKLEAIGASVTDGVVHFSEVLIKKLNVSKLIIKDATDVSKTGYVIYDRATGQPVCVYFENGVQKIEPGDCEDVVVPERENDDGDTIVSTEPVITDPVIEEPAPEDEPEVLDEPAPAPVPGPEPTPTEEPSL